MVAVPGAALQNLVFFGVLAFALLMPWRGTDRNEGVISRSRSTELKGAGVLFVIFAHIGYYLVSDHSFLFPLSTFAGTGVNLFLFLSGYGLTASALTRARPIMEFYVRHVKKLYLPLWLVLVPFFVADYYFLGRWYGGAYVLRSFLGFFPHADLYADLDSPLWYVTFAVFLYALFPIVFSRKRPWLSAIAIAALSYAATYFTPLSDVSYLWMDHWLAFPLGMVVAWLGDVWASFPRAVRRAQESRYARPAAVGLLFFAAWYLTLHAGVGTSLEQGISLITLAVVLGFFVLKKRHSALLVWIGTYSYELYLLHWPILDRYDSLYALMPAWLATCASLMLVFALAVFLNRVARRLER